MKTIADMTESEAKALLNEIADKFSIGSKARTGPTILANFENTLRRERCLSMIERHHTVTVFDEDGEELRDCLLNWGENPEQYIRTYRSIIGA